MVEEGKVRVTGRVEVEGNRFVQPGLGAGELFGEHCLFQQGWRSASVVGVSADHLIEIDGVRLEGAPSQGFGTLRYSLIYGLIPLKSYYYQSISATVRNIGAKDPWHRPTPVIFISGR